MSALDLLEDAIEKAGVKRMPASTRLGLRFAERRGMTTSAKRYFKVDTNADYDTGKKPTREKVRVKGLTATQNTLHAGFRAQKNPSNKPISVYRSGGKTVIMEGHHRSARAAARGQTHIDALVYRKPRIKKALEALDAAIAKAGLIKPGKPSLLRRVGFLLSTGSNERNYKIGRYLEGRKAGKGFGPKGKRRARTGTYTGVYATGVNKSETVMDAIEALDEAIEKARGMIPRGGSSKLARRIARQGAKLRDSGGDPKAAKRFSALGTLANRRKGNSIGLGYEPGKGYKSLRRTGVYKSNEPTALDQLDEAIEKARGLIVGGSRANYKRAVDATDSARRVRDATAGKSPSLSAKYGKLAVRRKRAEDYLRSRTKRK
jgi:hypothetical protein